MADEDTTVKGIDWPGARRIEVAAAPAGIATFSSKASTMLVVKPVKLVTLRRSGWLPSGSPTPTVEAPMRKVRT